MKLGQLIGLPWVFVGIITALINSVLAISFYQIGIFVGATYSSLWILPVLANIFAFIFSLIAVVGIVIAFIGLIVFGITLFHKN